MRLTLSWTILVLLGVCGAVLAGQRWDYLANPVTATDPDMYSDWSMNAQAAFDGYGGTNQPTAVAHGWIRHGTPSEASPFVCTVDYKQPVAVSKFVVFFWTPECRDYRFNDPLCGPAHIVSVKIYRVPSTSQWTLAGAFANLPADFPQVLGLPTAVAARYYKFEVTGLAAAYYGLRVYEIETYTGPVIYKTETLTSPARTGESCSIKASVSGASSYTGMTIRVAPGPDYVSTLSNVRLDAQGQAVVAVRTTRPGRVPVTLELVQSGQVLDATTAYVTASTRIVLSDVTVDASGVHGTALNNGLGPLATTISWKETSVSLGQIPAGESRSFEIPRAPEPAGLHYAELVVREGTEASFTYRKAYKLSALPSDGTLIGQESNTDWSVVGSQLMLATTPAGASASIRSTLGIKLDNTDLVLAPAESSSGSLTIRAETAAGILEIGIVPEGSGVRLSYELLPSGVDLGAKLTNVLDLALATRTRASFRFLPGWVYSDELASQALEANFCPTRMAAVTGSEGTVALVPSVDRCRLGIIGNAAVTTQRFAGGPIVVRIAATQGDWFEAFKYVVSRIYQFADPLQYRPLIDMVCAESKYLAEDPTIWSPTYQTLRSFPNTDYFFNFYGVPYSLPALYSRYLATGDINARNRALGIVNWLRTSAIRSSNPATAGAFYSSYIEGIGPTDQAHNNWLEPHSSGVGAWTLLYYYNASGRTDAAVLASARSALDWLISIQKPNGGWNYAYLPNGIPVTDQEDAGNIWNIWALYRMWRYTGEQKYLDAALRGRDWFAATWLPKRLCRGYWEDGSGYQGQVNLTTEAYEFAIATLVFAEMGESTLAVECAKNAVTWTWTRTVAARDYFNSYGHAHEQLGWPPATYVAPMFGMAAHVAYVLSNDEFFAPFAGTPKVIGWWIEQPSGAGFWPLEGITFVPLEGPLTIQYWVDWITAQQASLGFRWLVSEVNRRCPGKIALDAETFRGTVMGEEATLSVRESDCSVASRAHSQINWLGYRFNQGYALAVMNHSTATDVDVYPNLAGLGIPNAYCESLVTSNGAEWTTYSAADPSAVRVSIPAGGTAILVWRVSADAPVDLECRVSVFSTVYNRNIQVLGKLLSPSTHLTSYVGEVFPASLLTGGATMASVCSDLSCAASYPLYINNANSGAGRVAFFPARIDAAYYQYPYPYQWVLLKDAVVWAASAPPTVTVVGPKSLQTAFFTQNGGKRIVVHLLNTTNTRGAHANPAGDVPARDEIAPLYDIEVWFSGTSPTSAKLQPENQALQLVQQDGRTKVVVSELGLHSMVVADLP